MEGVSFALLIFDQGARDLAARQRQAERGEKSGLALRMSTSGIQRGVKTRSKPEGYYSLPARQKGLW